MIVSPSSDSTARARQATIERVIAPLGLPKRAQTLKRLGPAHTELGDVPERRNDAAWAEAVDAWLAGEDDAAAGHARRARELSDPPGEFPAMLLR